MSTKTTTTISHGHVAERSPTGDATQFVAWIDNGEWVHSSGTDPMRKLVLPPGTKIYETAEAAIVEARFRWRCNGGRSTGSRPRPIAVVEGK